MIVTEMYNGQGLGNQLFCYVTTRTIAKDKGFKFGIKSPEKFKGGYFLDLDFGEEVVGGEGPEGGPPIFLPQGIKRYYVEKKQLIIDRKTDIRGLDKSLLKISDNTKIDGVMQDENYFLHRKQEVKKWLKVKKKYENLEFSKPDLCVINFRGGEYITSANLFLTKSYWCFGIKNMLLKNPKMKFIVVTDDPESAKQYFPKYKIFHWNLAHDYSVLNNAHNLLLSNSSFAWFPAWTSEKLKFCIAPKYWARHNVSDGYWSLAQNLTRGWNYQDRSGNLSSYDQCLGELANYVPKTETKDISSRPTMKKLLGSIFR